MPSPIELRFALLTLQQNTTQPELISTIRAELTEQQECIARQARMNDEMWEENQRLRQEVVILKSKLGPTIWQRLRDRFQWLWGKS